MNASQAARLLNVSTKQVTRWCADGTLKASRSQGDRGRWVITENDVSALADSRRAALIARLPARSKAEVA